MELNTDLIISFVSKLADSHGHHFTIGKVLAASIVKWAGLLPLSKGTLYTGLLLATMSTYESGNKLNIRGDGGRSYCALQVQNCNGHKCDELLKDADKCVEAGLKIFQKSEEVCPADPIAMYASGLCPGSKATEKNHGGKRVSADRTKKMEAAFEAISTEKSGAED